MTTSISDERARARSANTLLAQRHDYYIDVLGLTPELADVLTGDEDVVHFFDAAVAVYNNPKAIANWVANEVLRELKGRSLEQLPFTAVQLAELVKLVDQQAITSAGAKSVFAAMLAEGGAPSDIVRRLGLDQTLSAQELQAGRRPGAGRPAGQGRRISCGQDKPAGHVHRPGDQGDGRQGKPAGSTRDSERQAGMKDELKPARVRFAPSPTGHLHLGGLRTALFDWLYARRTGGQFILRIEDTDQKRYNPESLNSLTTGLRWLGLDWDEGPDVGGPFGPYVQSERKPLYEAYAQQLVDAGKAYRCYTTEAELEELRKQGKEYDRRHRWLTPEQRAAFEAEGRAYVVRFAIPLEGSTTVHDVIRGEVVVENQRIPVDPVLLKSDGMPTYHLAVVVDDHLMEITHILRGEEWLPSAPLHELLYEAFGWEKPEFVHLPVILDPSGKGKMSKRKPLVDGHEMPGLCQRLHGRKAICRKRCSTSWPISGWSFDAEREIFTRDEASRTLRRE